MLKLARRIFYSIATIVALYFAIAGFMASYPNFHTVLPGKVYRSAQLSRPEFLRYIKEYHIKSVINLRGAANTSRWYHQEISASKEANVQHYDLQLNAMKTNSKENMITLAKLLEKSPKPILIHCWHGADRTGLASAMAIILFTQQPLAKAEQQTSVRFLAIDPRSTGKVEMALYKEWLHQHQLKNNKSSFLKWLDSLSS